MPIRQNQRQSFGARKPQGSKRSSTNGGVIDMDDMKGTRLLLVGWVGGWFVWFARFVWFVLLCFVLVWFGFDLIWFGLVVWLFVAVAVAASIFYLLLPLHDSYDFSLRSSSHHLKLAPKFFLTLLGINMSPSQGTFESMIFLFPRWNMLLPWRVPLPLPYPFIPVAIPQNGSFYHRAL